MLTRVLAISGLVLGGAAFILALDLWLDQDWVRRFQEREQMTVRPPARYRPPKPQVETSPWRDTMVNAGYPQPGTNATQRVYSDNIKPGQSWMAG
jgi:hypothetical protein